MNVIGRTALLILCVGCADPAAPHLKRLVDNWADVVANGYTHNEAYTREQHGVHYAHEQSRATNRMIAQFLASNPPVGKDLKGMLRDWQIVVAENEQLHKAMIDEGRFTYTDSERERAADLSAADFAAGMDLATRLEGY